jgi:uncharacterized protein YecE (DUF72 family)
MTLRPLSAVHAAPAGLTAPPLRRPRRGGLVICNAVAQAHPEYRVGTASWTDPTLLATGFYPPTAKSAEARLRYYAEHFDTVEVDSTYYALPAERNAVLWAQRTPDGFQFNIKAFALLTQHPAETRALPAPLKALLSAEALRQPRLSHPPASVLELSFEMFRAALVPLRRAGKLGCILLQFPPWFVANATHEAYIDFCRARLPGDSLAIEFRHTSWFDDHSARTLDFLTERGLSLVCVDAPQAASIVRPAFLATTDIAYVRLHGRNRRAWFQRAESAAQRFNYLYSEAELHDCAAAVQGLRPTRSGSRAPRVVYVIFNNCYADYGVRNALTMKQLLGT